MSGQPKVGDRHSETGARDLEWTGDAGAPVCSSDDIAMVARDGEGWLCCGACGIRSVDDRPGVPR